jgi:hypothetical protein
MRLPPIVRLLRPQQWTKNLACMAGVVFGGPASDSRMPCCSTWR